MADKAKELLLIEAAEIEATLPAEVLSREIESLNPTEAMGRASLSGLHQLIRIIEQPLRLKQTDDEALTKADLQLQRLIGERAEGVLRSMIRAAGEEFRRREADEMAELLREIAAEKIAAKGG